MKEMMNQLSDTLKVIDESLGLEGQFKVLSRWELSEKVYQWNSRDHRTNLFLLDFSAPLDSLNN